MGSLKSPFGLSIVKQVVKKREEEEKKIAQIHPQVFTMNSQIMSSKLKKNVSIGNEKKRAIAKHRDMSKVHLLHKPLPWIHPLCNLMVQESNLFNQKFYGRC